MSTATTTATPALMDADGYHWQDHHYTPDFKSNTELQGFGCSTRFHPGQNQTTNVIMTFEKQPLSAHFPLSPNAARALAQSLLAAAARAEEVDQLRQQLATQQPGG
ncbi:hypothetical protein [Comamonas terrigena]|uniref:hypothetical protein n=1 Tax=Comamonas terrigena TaxID=32013 RepID=UPI00244B7A4D|nr:hypothetical protein [Comamonas terrigena]MDH1700308.1 hypothetical protein [Comamonas terrigena]